MILSLWISLLLAGVAVAAVSSHRAVGSALAVTERLGVSASLVGVTVLAVGTDLPEIANSIMASLSGHGDLNVGDSTGSALTQVTLVLAILIVAARLDTTSGGRDESSVVTTAGLMTVGALVLLAVLLADGTFSRVDGLVMVTGWVVTLVPLTRRDPGGAAHAGGAAASDAPVGRPLAQLMLWLVLVGVAATAVITSFTAITAIIGVPEYIASSVVLALGTSLPELVVDWAAIRRGVPSLAIGDLFGSSLVDATLSVGIGPTLRGTAVSSEAVIGTLVIAVGVACATVIVANARQRAATAGGLLVVYGLATSVLLTLVG